MSTAADIWEVMAEEIGGHTHNPLEAFVYNGRLAGVRFQRSPKMLEPIQPDVNDYVTLESAIAMETRGEGTVKFIGGVPTWLPAPAHPPPPREEPYDIFAIPPKVAK